MYLGGPTFELGGPTFESRVGLFSGEGSSKIRPSLWGALFEQILNSSPMGVFSRDYGIIMLDASQTILRVHVSPY